MTTIAPTKTKRTRTNSVQTFTRREAQGLVPKSRPIPSDWAGKNIYLSPESAPEPGYYRGKRAPYQKGIIDSQHEKGIDTTVFVSSTQVGKTLIELITIGYVIDVAPGPALMVQPSIKMAEEFSRERLMPAIRDSPALRAKVDLRGRSTANTLLKKEFLNGYLALTGANSPSGLAARSIKYLFLDEIDRYPEAIGNDADPVNQVLKRVANFRKHSIWMVSSPTLTRTSRVLKLWELSDKRRYFVSCPHCGHKQHLVWEQVLYPGKGTPDAEPLNAHYACMECGSRIENKQKLRLLKGGEWIATERKPKRPGVAGFHLNELYSPWREWADVALDYENAKDDPLQLQVFYNTSLALGWDDDSNKLEWETIAEEADNSDYERGQVHPKVSMLTAGVDVQGDRIEISVWGWGENQAAYLVDHQVVYGQAQDDDPWDEVEAYLTKGFWRGEFILKPKITFVDSGNWTKEVYAQVKKRKALGWHSVKGKGGDRILISDATPVEVNQRGVKMKTGIKARILGVDLAKDTLYNRLRLPSHHPKRLHFPMGMELSYFQGFCSEIKTLRHKGGQPYFQWEKLPGGNRNEPLDCAVYAYCAAVMAGLDRVNWKAIEKQLEAQNNIRLNAEVKPALESTYSMETALPTPPLPSPIPRRNQTVASWMKDL